MSKKKKKSTVKSPGTCTGEGDTVKKPDGSINPVDQLQQLLLSLPTQGIPQDKVVLPNASLPVKEKSKKIVTTKTFTKGMMDISLLTSNATQLRSVLMDPDHTFRELLLWLLILSICLQVTSTLLLILADAFKSNDTEKDNSNSRRHLTFSSMALTILVTVANILISAFYMPGDHRSRVS
ncbi:uncharacterized protein LOC117319984 [Pecten maximus]|uniref:uncharacterized protein LOC117319984 n=1 Tax=Pecten maximus TaxID=6579 RepID=UPI0014587F5B|nr:uncharacterized protein LOC117319984 [Pecten maximus]